MFYLNCQVCKQILTQFKGHIVHVIENHETLSLEDHVKNTCIVSLQACQSFAAIPSVARENEKKLQKNKDSNTKSKPVSSTQKVEKLYGGPGGVDNKDLRKKYDRDEL